MAPLKVHIGDLDVLVTARPLTRESFASFGDAVQNPRPDLRPSGPQSPAPSTFALPAGLPFDGVAANQGSAVKFQRVSRPRDLYAQAPSGVRGEQIVSMFVCAARTLEPRAGPGPGTASCFVVEILERHPFTTQMFVPLRATDPSARYLVVVAPSLPSSAADRDLPVPKSEPGAGSGSDPRPLPGRGLPDLRRLQAFVALPGQAVTYGAGTWHAPMVALGEPGSVIDFVVVQTANGVGIEDCQEVVFEPGGRGRPRVAVRVPGPGLAKL